MSVTSRIRFRLAVAITGIGILVLSAYFFHTYQVIPTSLPQPPAQPETPDPPHPPPPPPVIRFKNDTLRPLAARPPFHMRETFPAAAAARSPADLPPVPAWNAPPKEHVEEATPIYIGFTRNWNLLQQTVVALITAGWPPSDIYVVENTGVMDANQKGQLSPDNPFYLDHHRLTNIFEVNVITLPSLQTFAQLQNFYLYHAISNNWAQYYWSHMDVMIQTHERRTPYLSFYMKAVNALRDVAHKNWAAVFFNYDWVTLMNTAAMSAVGGWDSMISYYLIDCDMYDRLTLSGFSNHHADCGAIYDVGESIEDLKVLYREGDELNSTIFYELQAIYDNLSHRKEAGGRNDWQIAQTGGQGDPYYRDLDGFVEALNIHIESGKRVYQAKWHLRGCGLVGSTLKPEDAWHVESFNDF